MRRGWMLRPSDGVAFGSVAHEGLSLKNNRHKQSGFSLIEVIAVVVILGIIAVIGTQFIVHTTESYRVTQSRALLANTGRQAVERMTRQLRGALPYSVRLTNGGQCIQFMPIAAAGFYRPSLPLDRPIDTLVTSPYRIDYYSADYLVLGALGSDEVYNGLARTPVTTMGATAIGFNAHTFIRNSESQRFYLVSEPQAFCFFNGQLHFYSNLSPTDSAISLGAPDELLARNVVSTEAAVFALNGATAENNIIVNINIGFSEGGETVDFFQEVSLRNVP